VIDLFDPQKNNPAENVIDIESTRKTVIFSRIFVEKQFIPFVRVLHTNKYHGKMKPFIVCYLCLWFDLNASLTSGWTLTTTTVRTTTNLLEQRPPSTTTATPSSSGVYYQPIFQFPKDIEWIDRLDDVIMGGISTSSVQPSEEGYARWIGVCRTDGGYVFKMKMRK
jgi:hypothetical protein